MILTGRMTWGAGGSSFFPQDDVKTKIRKIRPVSDINGRKKMGLSLNVKFIFISDTSLLMNSQKVKKSICCHSGESRNPVIAVCSGCPFDFAQGGEPVEPRIKSGMTNKDFLRDHQN
jgi:hypothetical protein